MNIRKGVICDLTSIINIEKAVYNKPYWNVAMLKKLFIDSVIETVWVIENQKKIIGFLIEQRCDNEINLLNVAIDRPFQNKGIGKKLINHYLDLISGNCSVFLEVNKTNIIARKIYSDLNFKNIDMRKNYYNDGGDAFLMKYTK